MKARFDQVLVLDQEDPVRGGFRVRPLPGYKTPGSPKRARVWVSVYYVNREYGGPEEGGWWYNWYTHVETIRVPLRFAEHHRRRLEYKHRDHHYGNIYSVMGGQQVQVFIEGQPKQHETKRRPHYE